MNQQSQKVLIGEVARVRSGFERIVKDTPNIQITIVALAACLHELCLKHDADMGALMSFAKKVVK